MGEGTRRRLRRVPRLTARSGRPVPRHRGGRGEGGTGQAATRRRRPDPGIHRSGYLYRVWHPRLPGTRWAVDAGRPGRFFARGLCWEPGGPPALLADDAQRTPDRRLCRTERCSPGHRRAGGRRDGWPGASPRTSMVSTRRPACPTTRSRNCTAMPPPSPAGNAGRSFPLRRYGSDSKTAIPTRHAPNAGEC